MISVTNKELENDSFQKAIISFNNVFDFSYWFLSLDQLVSIYFLSLLPVKFQKMPRQIYVAPETMSDDYQEIKTCPYDPSHRVHAKRFLRHLMKCQKNYPNAKMVCFILFTSSTFCGLRNLSYLAFSSIFSNCLFEKKN